MNGINMIGAIPGQDTGSAAGNQSLGQQDFLELMIAQLKNQDPMKPMENGDFLGQMAQFSTVNGIEDLNRSVASVTGALAANQALQAASLVERSALIEADSVQIEQGGSISGVVELPGDVSHGLVTIRDVSGQEVARIPVTNDGTGTARFEWDGLDADGQPLPGGQYDVAAEYQSGSQTQSASTYLWGEIESVSLFGSQSGMQMTLKGLGTVSLSAAREIS